MIKKYIELLEASIENKRTSINKSDRLYCKLTR